MAGMMLLISSAIALAAPIRNAAFAVMSHQVGPAGRARISILMWPLSVLS